MANKHKAKGDRAEREAVQVLTGLTPDLARPNARRLLGAGRADDIGDLHVYTDVAVQVRAYATSALGTAIRTAAADAATQAARGDMTLGLGMVPLPHTRTDGTQVRWIAATLEDHWPTPVEATCEFKQVSRAIAWVKDDSGPPGYTPHQRDSRIGLLAPNILIAPIEAWATAYVRRHSHARAS